MPRYADDAVPVRKRGLVRKVAVVKRAPVKRRAAPRRVNESNYSVVRRSVRRAGTSELGGMLGGMAGMALGGPPGAMIGNMVGNVGGSMLSKIFGSGDYRVNNAGSLKKNNIVLANNAQAPQFGANKVACKIVHREFLGDVFSSSTPGAFKIDSFPINPGQSKTFPWLSGVVAAKFQQHRINGMAFEFRSRSSDALNSTNTALGSVIMSTDYDSADSTFTTKREMENTEYGVSCKPSENMLHGIECARGQTPVNELFIRAFDVPSGKDIRFYDLGRFSIATVGCQGANVNLGELWVTYDIDVFKAIEQVPGYLTPYSQYALNSSSATAPLGTSRQPLLTTATASQASEQQLALTIDENKISWPIDIDEGSVYMVDLALLGAAPAALTPPAVTTGNGMFINVNGYWKSFTAGITDVMHLWYTVKYVGGATPDALPYINIADFTWAPAGGVIEGDLVVSQLSGRLGGTFTSQAEITSTEGPNDYVRVYEEQKTIDPRRNLR